MSRHANVMPARPKCDIVAATVCEHCDVPFSIVRRRHMCRGCGALVCGACSPGRSDLPTLDTARAAEHSASVLRRVARMTAESPGCCQCQTSDADFESNPPCKGEPCDFTADRSIRDGDPAASLRASAAGRAELETNRGVIAEPLRVAVEHRLHADRLAGSPNTRRAAGCTEQRRISTSVFDDFVSFCRKSIFEVTKATETSTRRGVICSEFIARARHIFEAASSVAEAEALIADALSWLHVESALSAAAEHDAGECRRAGGVPFPTDAALMSAELHWERQLRRTGDRSIQSTNAMRMCKACDAVHSVVLVTVLPDGAMSAASAAAPALRRVETVDHVAAALASIEAEELRYATLPARRVAPVRVLVLVRTGDPLLPFAAPKIVSEGTALGVQVSASAHTRQSDAQLRYINRVSEFKFQIRGVCAKLRERVGSEYFRLQYRDTGVAWKRSMMRHVTPAVPFATIAREYPHPSSPSPSHTSIGWMAPAAAVLDTAVPAPTRPAVLETSQSTPEFSASAPLPRSMSESAPSTCTKTSFFMSMNGSVTGKPSRAVSWLRMERSSLTPRRDGHQAATLETATRTAIDDDDDECGEGHDGAGSAPSEALIDCSFEFGLQCEPSTVMQRHGQNHV